METNRFPTVAPVLGQAENFRAPLVEIGVAPFMAASRATFFVNAETISGR